MAEPAVNDELFVAVLAQIEREPKRWEQGWYATETACGTAYCFAGWAVALSGLTLDATTLSTSDGRGVVPAADDLLGVSGSSLLYAARNSLADLYRISAEHMGIAVEVLKEKVAAVVADGRTQR